MSWFTLLNLLAVPFAVAFTLYATRLELRRWLPEERPDGKN